jgi:hypothetical protein
MIHKPPHTKLHSKCAFRRHGDYLWDCTGWKPLPPFDYTLVSGRGNTRRGSEDRIIKEINTSFTAIIYTLVLVLGLANAIMAQKYEVKPTDPGYLERNSPENRRLIEAQGPKVEAAAAELLSVEPQKLPPVAQEPEDPPPDSPRFYFEPHIGLGGIGPTSSLTPKTRDDSSAPGLPASVHSRIQIPGRLAPALSVGAKVGTWFDYGFLPPLAKHVGFCLNYSYQPLQFSSSSGTFWQTAYHPATSGSSWTDWSSVSDPRFVGFSERFTPVGVIMNILTGSSVFRSTGGIHNLGFLFKARFGLLPDSKVPFGRLQPWVGVGPSINFIYQRATVKFDTLTSVNGTPTFVANLNDYFKYKMGSDKVLGLQAAAGLKWMVFSTISLDFSVQYDKFTVSYTFTTPGQATGTINYPVDNFSFNLGLAYHL